MRVLSILSLLILCCGCASVCPNCKNEVPHLLSVTKYGRTIQKKVMCKECYNNRYCKKHMTFYEDNGICKSCKSEEDQYKRCIVCWQFHEDNIDLLAGKGRKTSKKDRHYVCKEHYCKKHDCVKKKNSDGETACEKCEAEKLAKEELAKKIAREEQLKKAEAVYIDSFLGIKLGAKYDWHRLGNRPISSSEGAGTTTVTLEKPFRGFTDAMVSGSAMERACYISADQRFRAVSEDYLKEEQNKIIDLFAKKYGAEFRDVGMVFYYHTKRFENSRFKIEVKWWHAPDRDDGALSISVHDKKIQADDAKEFLKKQNKSRSAEEGADIL